MAIVVYDVYAKRSGNESAYAKITVELQKRGDWKLMQKIFFNMIESHWSIAICVDKNIFRYKLNEKFMLECKYNFTTGGNYEITYLTK